MSGALARVAQAATGVWLMVAPAVLGYGPPAADSDRIAGPIAASFAIVALWQAGAGLRWAAGAVGAWVAFAPMVLGSSGAAAWNGVLSGLVLVACALPSARRNSRMGGGWRTLLPGGDP